MDFEPSFTGGHEITVARSFVNGQMAVEAYDGRACHSMNCIFDELGRSSTFVVPRSPRQILAGLVSSSLHMSVSAAITG